ncbi:MAG TPA: monofunctional biosynthetic peptidoglycan transglycosylase [Candidatus Binatia bacterium]
MLRWLGRLLFGALLASVAVVGLFRFVDPPLTPLMVIRAVQGALDGRWVGIQQRWVPLEEVSPALLRAVIAAEDARFFQHHGFDFEEIERARAYNERHGGRRVRGASTISMQTARNVFLWQDRTWVRKGLEAYFTLLIELLWSKRRILEVYVNVAEWGDGVYGVEAAAQNAFGKPAAKLGAREASLLAAVLPSPRRWSARTPSSYVQSRAARIAARAAQVDLRPLG